MNCARNEPSTGSFNTSVRPVKVTGASSVSGNFRQGMEVISFEEYGQIDDGSGLTAALPSKLAADNAYPLVNLRVWPIPNQPSSIEIHSWQPIASFASLADTINLPPGYERAAL